MFHPLFQLQPRLMKRVILAVLISLGVLFVAPGLVLAQGDGGGGFDISWGVIIAGLISGVLVPLAVQFLTWSWPTAPTWLKGLAGPVLAPGLALAAMLLSNALGFPIDFGPIVAIIVGAGTGASIAFTLGKRKGLLKIRRR